MGFICQIILWEIIQSKKWIWWLELNLFANWACFKIKDILKNHFITLSDIFYIQFWHLNRSCNNLFCLFEISLDPGNVLLIFYCSHFLKWIFMPPTSQTQVVISIGFKSALRIGFQTFGIFIFCFSIIIKQ